MSPGPGQRTTLRVGAAVLVVAAAVLGLVALSIDSSPTPSAAAAEDPTDVTLPELGLFGGRVTVYADTEDRVAPRELGCALVTGSGTELSSAKMSALGAASEPVEVDGTSLSPLFSVSSYPDGARVQCPGAEAVAPVALSAPSTFGAFGALVRGVAGAGALVCLLVAGVGLLLSRRPGG